MGEYANDQMRADMGRMFGFDPGDLNDDDSGRWHAKTVHKRVQCPHCDSRPKEPGLWDHVRDVHGIGKAEQSLAKLPDSIGESTMKSVGTDVIAEGLRSYLETPHLVDGWITPQALMLKDGQMLSTSYFKTAGGGLILREALEADNPESQIGLMQRFDEGERFDVSGLSRKVGVERKMEQAPAPARPSDRKVEQAPAPAKPSVLFPLFERKKSLKKAAGPSM